KLLVLEADKPVQIGFSGYYIGFFHDSSVILSIGAVNSFCSILQKVQENTMFLRYTAKRNHGPQGQGGQDTDRKKKNSKTKVCEARGGGEWLSGFCPRGQWFNPDSSNFFPDVVF
ncbi:MAG: hypothetical protein LBT33_02650, partial [Spirochaetia bacterium]|nr:hypothetical protein [Spirochaetia bacterium]